jgi:hypothetical protein
MDGSYGHDVGYRYVRTVQEKSLDGTKKQRRKKIMIGWTLADEA